MTFRYSHYISASTVEKVCFCETAILGVQVALLVVIAGRHSMRVNSSSFSFPL